MKKFLYTSAAIFLFCLTAVPSFAQGRFGLLGGVTFSSAKISELKTSSVTQYHAGLTYQLKLPLGFSIQPALQYHVKGTRLDNVLEGAPTSFDLKVGYLELPVSFQWGPDLLLLRPFLDVTPYIGYGINSKMSAGAVSASNNWKEACLKRMEYGLGLGIGLEVWRFQIIGRYNWNFGSLYSAKQLVDSDLSFPQIMKSAFSGSNFSGITLTLAFLF